MQKLVTGITSEPLTDREAEVLQLLAHGKSNKEIGASLFISEFTVKGHLHSIFTKLNVLSRTEAVATATRRGLVRLFFWVEEIGLKLLLKFFLYFFGETYPP